MNRIIPFFFILMLTTACLSVAPTQTPPPTPPELAPTQSASTSTDAAPAITATPLLYISGTTHIESKPQSWPDVDAFLGFLQQVTSLGLKWSVGADIGWLEGEARAAEVIQKSEAMGVQWDIHTHNAEDRAKAASLITQMGGHPDSVVSGMLINELTGLYQPQVNQGFTWTPKVLWGGTSCAGHRPGCDDLAAGIWMPLNVEQYTTHDPNGSFIRVGGGTHQLDDGRALAQSIANGTYTYPVISFTLMVAPKTLKIVESTDGIAEITTFANEMNAYSFVRWGTIEETAQAWVQAGSVPSRIEMQ